ncbi:MAG: serine/threonine-protein kinase [Anaerolineaceae bacterium]|nr:serine/threonine-protein kinase [Anaerolineaceae bacterium]
MPLSVNTRLNQRYRILEIIAIGGMGSIYKALDESLNIEVALKENLFRGHDSTRQFHYEAKILANLKHPNLPRVTDHFSIPNQGQYLVMDFIYGEDLKDRIEKLGVLPERDARLIGAAICNALSYLHHQEPKIIHRDVKPGNIKITPAGEVYLVDFGLAKQAHPGQETTTGAQALTPGYAPPEQYGQGTEPRSDIYSLGATLYAAVTGEVPADALARTIGSGELVPIQSLNKLISPGFAKCIAIAMAVDPKKRFQNAEQFKNALLTGDSINTQDRDTKNYRIAPMDVNALPTRSASNGKRGNTHARTTFGGAQKKDPSLKSESTIPLGVIIGIITIIVLFGAWIGYRVLTNIYQATQQSQMQPTMAEIVEATQSSGLTETDEVPTSDTPAPADENTPSTEEIILDTTPENAIGGSSGVIAFVSTRSGIPQVWTMKADGSEPTQITNLPDGACYPDWSPDGKKMVITSPCREKQELYRGSALFIINADGSSMRPIISVPGGDFNGVWSPDGTKILFTSLRDNTNIPHLYVLDIQSNTSTRITSVASHDRNATWSPDGSQIALESTRVGVSQIWIMDANGENIKEFTNNDVGAGYMPDWADSGNIIVFSLGSTRGLYAKQVENRSAPEVEITSMRPIRDAAFSPDSYWIAFEGQEGDNKEIFLITINGSGLLNITKNEADDFHPVWQP